MADAVDRDGMPDATEQGGSNELRRDERVRIRAYHLWERDGRPHGRNDHYWDMALQQIRAEADAGRDGAPA
jgi:hypothetical protein